MLITCPNCNISSDIPDDKIPEGKDYVSCKNCKNKFKFRNSSLSTLKSDDDFVNRKNENIDNKFYGLRGWLLLLIFVVFINSIFNIIYLPVAFNNIISFIIFSPLFAVGFYGFYVLYLLLLKKSSAPKHASYFLFAQLILSVLFGLMEFFETYEAQKILQTLFGVLFFFIWLDYLKKSKRVAVTYKANSKI